MAIDPVELAQALIAIPSVTPARGEVFDVLEQALASLGFAVHRFVLGDPPDGPTENLVAIRGDGTPHFGFAGHLDVVPPGDGWSVDPFEARIEDATIYTRPWTARFPLKLTPEYEWWEYACHEGNRTIRDFISVSRAERAYRAAHPNEPRTPPAPR